MRNLADVLTQYRYATKRTLRELAADIGISYATLSRIEHGEMPDGNTLRKILQWLLKA